MKWVDLPAVRFDPERGSIEVGTPREAAFLSDAALDREYAGVAVALDNLRPQDFPYRLDRHNSSVVAGFVINYANGTLRSDRMPMRQAERYLVALGSEIFQVSAGEQLAA